MDKKIKKTKLDYRKMLEDILPLVENDFCFDMSLKGVPNSKPYTDQEGCMMADIIGKIYLIAHSIHCEACAKRYLK